MLTIEHCDNLHLHLPAQGETLLSRAITEGIRRAASAEQAAAAAVQTTAPAAKPPLLGETWSAQGGLYAGTMPARPGKPGYHLVLADEQAENLAFGPYDHDVAGAVDHYDGLANTAALVQDAKEHPAAEWARNLCVRPLYQQDALSDFYLPAHNELMLMWICVPHLFKKEGWYWTSTQYSPYYAWAQRFEHGGSLIYGKSNEFRAVAVRRLAI